MFISAGSLSPVRVFFYEEGNMPFMTNEEQDLWLSIKAELQPEMRNFEIYRLRYAGYTFREIGKRVNLSHVGVWKRWRKIKNILRERLTNV